MEQIEIKIYNKDDRLRVAQILIDNGYTVSQVKKPRGNSGKTIDYLLRVSESEENAITSRT